MMDRFSRKPAKNPLQKKMDELKQRDGTITELNTDIQIINNKLSEIRNLDATTAARAQDEYFRETGEYVTIDEMRDTLFEKLRHLKKLRAKVREGVHALLVKETDVIDPDKRK